jgi:hypothetical protein
MIWLAAEEPAVPITDFWGQINIVGLLNVGAGGLVTLFIIAFLRGWIFTRAHYNDIVEQRDRWEAAYWKEKEINTLKEQQNTEMVEVARVIKRFAEVATEQAMTQTGHLPAQRPPVPSGRRHADAMETPSRPSR